jgi:hypothetical protein
MSPQHLRRRKLCPEVFENLDTGTKCGGAASDKAKNLDGLHPQQNSNSLARADQPPGIRGVEPGFPRGRVVRREETSRGAREKQSSKKRMRSATALRRRLVEAMEQRACGSQLRQRNTRESTCSSRMPVFGLVRCRAMWRSDVRWLVWPESEQVVVLGFSSWFVSAIGGKEEGSREILNWF